MNLTIHSDPVKPCGAGLQKGYDMIRFGTGGWRAVIGDDFTRANIQILAKAMSMKIKHEGVEGNPIVIGYDRRFLSKEAVKWACEVFAAEGISIAYL